MPAAPTRAQIVEFVRRQAIPATRARIEMSFMLLVTTVAGLMASFGLLAAGLDSMALRYPLVVASAYAIFLFQLGLWLRQRLRREQGAARRESSGFDLGSGSGHGGSGSDWEPFRGGGGRFGGAGASGGWPAAGSGGSRSPASLASLTETGMRGPTRSRGGGGSGGGDGDSGKLVAIVALVLLALAVCAVFALLVFWAPALFAEILADGLIAGGLYRGARGLEATHWIRSALRRTLLPVLGVMVLASIVGIVVEHAVPGARWIGDVFVRGSGRPASPWQAPP